MTLTEGRVPPIEEGRRSPTSLAITLATPARHLKEGSSSQCSTEGFAKSQCPHMMWWVGAKGEKSPIMGTVRGNNARCTIHCLSY